MCGKDLIQELWYSVIIAFNPNVNCWLVQILGDEWCGVAAASNTRTKEAFKTALERNFLALLPRATILTALFLFIFRSDRTSWIRSGQDFEF